MVRIVLFKNIEVFADIVRDGISAYGKGREMLLSCSPADFVYYTAEELGDPQIAADFSALIPEDDGATVDSYKEKEGKHEEDRSDVDAHVDAHTNKASQVMHHVLQFLEHGTNSTSETAYTCLLYTSPSPRDS